MKKYLLVFALSFFCVASLAQAGEYVFEQPNNPANYIKLEDLKESKAQAMDIQQPHSFTQDQMIDILRSFRYSRKAVFSDKEKVRNVYEIEYINKFAPMLVDAFAKAKPNQAIFWSLAQKRPYVILRNDRLTQIRMWVASDGLHAQFIKTEAKLLGDYQAKITGRKLIENAKGLRISLEPQTGQKFSLNSTEELVLDLNTDWAQVDDAIDAEDAKLEEEEKGRRGRKQRESTTTVSTQPDTNSVPLSEKDRKTSEQRLSELKKLKEKGLISDQDYNKKKEEILGGI